MSSLSQALSSGTDVLSVLVICVKKFSQFGGPNRGGPLNGGAPCHGTIGTRVNPALPIVAILIYLRIVVIRPT